MLAYFGKVFRIDFRLNTDMPVLVGVSGGPDSLCLLDLLHKSGYLVIVAHLDHQLRPKSKNDARRVELIAEALGVEFVLEACDVKTLANEERLSVEQAGRQARYRFLFGQAEIHGAQAVAVGHNADDQAETVLMHFLQGAGLSGLAGMKPVSLPNAWSGSMPLIRPLLSTRRDQILEYCRTYKLQPIHDASNTETRFFRNRVRHELIPYLEDYVPGIRTRLVQMADILAEDKALLDDAVLSARNVCVLEQGEGYVSFDSVSLNYQPLSLQRRLIKWAVSTLRDDLRELDYAAIQRALSVLASGTGPQELVMGVRAFLEGDVYTLASQDAGLPTRHWPQLPTHSDEMEIELPARLPLSDGWVLAAKSLQIDANVREQALNNDDPLRAWIIAKERVSRLNARIRRRGDRIAPFGMEGKSKKISDIMIDQKIPERARARWPLFCLDNEIVWLPGYRQSDGTGVSAESDQVIFLQLIPPK